MAAVGIDIGNFSSYVGVARAGGIEIVANEYSERSTPTYVTFDQSKRSVGQASKAMEITHAKNTISNFKRLLGRKYQDLFVQQEKILNAYSIVEGNLGSVNIEVNYLNERKRFTPEQITAIILTKLRSIADVDLGTKPTDCVLAVPCYFTDGERRAMLNAAHIAGWNCLRLLNETTAVALCYGIYRNDLPEVNEKGRLVAFVDLGYTTFQSSIVSFHRGKLKMIATAADPSLGGRDFDQILMDAFREDFRQRFRLDAFSTVKSKLRLRAECEKTKKLMSSNAQTIPISLECFIDEKDVSGRTSRSEFENLSRNLLERIRKILQNLLKEAQLTADQIESVEIVGGSTRIPSVKQIIQEVFQKAAMTTMNGDESVARGCTLMCAMLSPTFKVKEFKVEDCQPYPITLSWPGSIDEDNEVEVFTRWSSVPSAKLISLHKKTSFLIDARYSYPNDIPFSESRIGQYTIEQIRPQPDGSPSKIQIKVRLNRSGIFDVVQAVLVEKNDEIDEPNDDQQNEPTDSSNQKKNETLNENNSTVKTNDVNNDENNRDEDNGEIKESSQNSSNKKRIKGTELPITVRLSAVNKTELDRFVEQEILMISNDKKEKECSDAKNAVEEYVYDMRDKLDGGVYEKFTDERIRQKLLVDLRSTENWLYGQGNNQDKNVYLDRLKTLKTVSDPIRQRYQEAENRQFYMQDFSRSLQKYNEIFKICQTRRDERYAHLDRTDLERLRKILQEKQSWYEKIFYQFNSLRQHENPEVLCSQIKQERENLEQECSSILNKPKGNENQKKTATNLNSNPTSSTNKKY